MRSAFALRIISGKIILNFAFVALCGALQTHFHGRGWNELPHTEKGCLPGGRQPFPEENKENTHPKGLGEYQNILSSL